MCVGLYVCLFVYVFVCMSVCLYVSLSVCGCLTMQSSALQHAGENMHPWNGVLAKWEKLVSTKHFKVGVSIINIYCS